MATRIPFGECDGRMCTATDVARGKACGCICPACGGPLVAYQGTHKVHHFGHLRHAAGCLHPAETALHRMAKQLVAEAAHFNVPAWTVTEQVHGNGLVGRGHADVCRAGRLLITDSQLEAVTSDGMLRPDVRLWGTIEGTDAAVELWVEIAVTHHVDDNKRERLRDAGQRCIEIDLGDWDPMNGRDVLAEAVIGDDMRKFWVMHPREGAARQNARQRAEADRTTREQSVAQQRNDRRAGIDWRVERREQILRFAREALLRTDRIVLPVCECRVAGKPAKSYEDIARTAREAGEWVVERTEADPSRPLTKTGLAKASADVRLIGPEGELWVVLESHAETNRRYPHHPMDLQKADVAAIKINLAWLERNGGRIEPGRLANTVCHSPKLKQWIWHPQLMQARADVSEEVKRIGKKLRAQRRIRLEREQRNPVHEAIRRMRESGRPRTQREVLIAYGAVRPTPEDGPLYRFQRERGWLVCDDCAATRWR